MPNFYIEPEEYLSNCSSHDIKQIIQFLIDDNYLPESTLKLPQQNEINISDETFEDALNALHSNRFKLTVDEEKIIIKIAERFKY